ncbi:MAG: aminoacyl-histidine dipeptidase [Deltaproteobacteria bacterium]|nr:aminoacyl-histidine dipeptidase [Deltaproteobacteria bacterium]
MDKLEPRALWKYFEMICGIPHGSTNTRSLGRAIVDLAKSKGLCGRIDRVGNVIIEVPATPGREASQTIVLQAHLDMVCEKREGTNHNFEKDAIKLVQNGDWISARDTTLGADNGIGVAAALAFMDGHGAPHNPLEILLTADEEIGLVGAMKMEPGFFSGKTILNLDGEDEGVFWFGCAGGLNVNIDLSFERKPARAVFAAYELRVDGLKGGHSGLDIHKNRGNAIRLLCRTISNLADKTIVELQSVDGGDKMNAIPREATAIIFIESGQEELLEKLRKERLEGFISEFGTDEPDLDLRASRVDAASHVLDKTSTDRVISTLCALPHGVQSMMRRVPDTVETSVNLALVRTDKDGLFILNSIRSSSDSALKGITCQIKSIAKLSGARLKTDTAYPGWQPNPDSKLLGLAKDTWRRLYGTEAEKRVIHGGLECGVLQSKQIGSEIVSFGPNIRDPHIPDERVSIQSVRRFFDFTTQLVSLHM